MHRAPWVLAGIAATSFAACGGTSDAGPSSAMLFVTTAQDADGDVSIAMVVRDGRVSAYACSSDVASDPYPGWFLGEAQNGHVDLARDGYRFVADWNDQSASGAIIDSDGTAIPWQTARSMGTGLTGLYAGPGATCATGVIVLDDGSSAPSVRGQSCGAAGEVQQVTPVLPVALVSDRLAVEIAGSEPRRLWVVPVTTPP